MPLWITCQRCAELRDRCDCPTYRGTPPQVCRRCGATAQQHLLYFAGPGDVGDRAICPEGIAR